MCASFHVVQLGTLHYLAFSYIMNSRSISRIKPGFISLISVLLRSEYIKRFQIRMFIFNLSPSCSAFLYRNAFHSTSCSIKPHHEKINKIKTWKFIKRHRCFFLHHLNVFFYFDSRSLCVLVKEDLQSSAGSQREKSGSRAESLPLYVSVALCELLFPSLLVRQLEDTSRRQNIF